MIPQEKAKELVEKFRIYCASTERINQDQSEYTEIKYAKECALISVNEILNEYYALPHFVELYSDNIEYWNEVNLEINKL